MQQQKPHTPVSKPVKDEKKERLSKALKANLLRRKAAGAERKGS